MPEPLSINLVHLKASETIAISAETKRRRAAGEEVYDLSLGEPDFDTPPLVAQAGVQAIQKGMTHYPPNPGIPELRAAIAKNLSAQSGGRPVNPDQILVSSGSKHSIFNACFTLFGPNDQVLIPAPAWVSYPQIVHLCRAEPVLVPGDIEWGLKVSAKDLDKHSTTRTKGLIICSPCNPTGAVYTLAELRSIAEWAKKNEVWIIADEIYQRINYGAGLGAELPRPAGRPAGADGGRLRRQQGVRDDRLADRRRLRAAARVQGDGGAAVAHHHRRQPSGAMGRGHGLRRRAGGGGRASDGGGVPRPPRPARLAVPRRGARRRVRRAARRVLLLLPRGRADRAGRRRGARSARS